MDGLGEVHHVPISDIMRPLQSVVDHAKVESLCETIQLTPDEVPPVTLLWVEGESGSNYFFGFGGCHRYEAFKKLGRQTIPAILQKSSLSTLKTMMGASAPTNLP
jgi:sulfiredoxin